MILTKSDLHRSKAWICAYLACLWLAYPLHAVSQDTAVESNFVKSTSSQELESSANTPQKSAQEAQAKIAPDSPPKRTKRLFTRAHSLSLVMAGDALLHTPVYTDAQKVDSSTSAITYNFAKMFAPIAPLIARYDLAFYNQETILGGTELGLSSYPSFNSPQEFGDTMLSLGFNLISLANNHTLDKGERGVRAMLAYWHTKEAESIARAMPITIAGSYASQEDRDKPRIYEKNGITYALLAYTYGTNGIPIPKGKEYLVNVYTKDMLIRDVKALRDKVDLLLVSMHWGIEYDFAPSKEQREFAALLASLGVDIVIGNHPHVIQPIEKIGNTLVIYSHGNLISAQKGINKRVGMLTSVRIHLFDTKKREALLARLGAEGGFVPRVSLSDLRAELIWTHYESGGKNFAIYPLRKVSNKLLPNAKHIYKDYTKILTQAWK
ncbi:CapA family protein [Helicobacter canis]|uniref:Putative capsule biosynthesis protein n=1 Tax=Helicobacter canis TaxID=29419 RepID=A0A377J6E2_9HELI|nr:CapA family protein [Helicobacter canis]STO98010.1 putative capsule biosynthesis protein [Helicobacter canis]